MNLKLPNSSNKLFIIDKTITVPYKLIEKLIKERFIHLQNDPDLQVYITFHKYNHYYKEKVSVPCIGIIYDLCCCFSYFKHFNLKPIEYEINKTEEEWQALINQWISPDSIKQSTI